MDRTTDFNAAAQDPRQLLDTEDLNTDKVELLFSRPVTVDRGGREYAPALLNPGYAEIVLGWIGDATMSPEPAVPR